MMVEGHSESPSAAFAQAVRLALRRLYDPDDLVRSPLVQVLPVDAGDVAASLQRLLCSAIESLKPGTGVSLQSNAWRTYYTLSARYVQQFQQAEVARDLGLSLRQMRRQDSRAIALLAGLLWTRYAMRECEPTEAGPAPSASGVPISPTDIPTRAAELEWLARTAPSGTLALPALVTRVLGIVAPLARAMSVAIEVSLPERMPDLVAHADSLRQGLLNLTTAAVRIAGQPSGKVQVMVEQVGGQVVLRIRSVTFGSRPGLPDADLAESMEIARQLLNLSGASLQVLPTSQGLDMDVRLQAAGQVPVLVIDDNVDILQLFQRYLGGTFYAFLGARNVAEALALATHAPPRVVVLDVMLPGVDGWEILGRLREHPSLSEVPVIICSILPQEQLALTLGAAAFLRKPVTQASLLSALERQLGRPSPEGA
ncbi:MAG: response regulator [Anaerolineae bacterium]